MADKPNVGYATLSVIPTVKGIGKQLEAELTQPFEKAAADAGTKGSKELERTFNKVELDSDQLFAGVPDAAKRASLEAAGQLDASKSEFGAAGQRLGGEFADGVESGADSLSAVADPSGLGSSGEFGAQGQRLGGEFADGIEAGASTADLSGTGAELGADMGGGILDGFPDISGGIGGLLDDALGSLPAGVAGPALAIGAAAGAMVVQGIGDALAKGQIETKLEASLGVSEGEAARLGRLVGDIYADNFGDSAEGVADAVGSVRRNFAGIGRQSEAELGKVSKAALTTASVFDQDLNGSIAASSTLIRTGLVKNSDEAFDLITTGLQGSANKADDLLDTFNEYSTQFRELGIDGKEALGLIEQGVEAGARDADLAADALKEFAIRAQDGTEATVSGFENLGLSATAMADAVAAGGGRAATALDTTLDRLRGIEDPALRAQIAVKLFGTQSEDMADALNAMDLSSAADQIGDIEGAAEDAQAAADDLASNFTVVRRKIEQAVEGAADRALDPLASAMKDGLNLEAVVDAVEIALNPLSVWIPDLFGDAGEEAGADFREGLASGLGIDAGRAIGESMQASRAGWEDFRGGIDRYRVSALDAEDASADLADEVEKLGDRVKPIGTSFDQAAVAADSFLDALDADPFDNLLASALEVDSALDTLGTSLAGLGDDVNIAAIAFGTEDPSAETAAILEDVLSAAAPFRDRIATALEFGGEDAARATADGIQADLLRIFETAGLTKQQITDMMSAMGLADEDIELAFKVSGIDVAIAQIQILQDMIGSDIGDPEFTKLEAFIGVKVQEEDFEVARDLMVAFQQDMVDGSLDNPILLAINGDTTPADRALEDFYAAVAEAPPVDARVDAAMGLAFEGVEEWRSGVENGRTPFAPVGANTFQAFGDVDRFGSDVESRLPFDVPIGADTKQAEKDIEAMLRRQRAFAISIGGSPSGDQTDRRAMGGPVIAGHPYIVGEREPELFIPNQSGQILNQSQIRDTFREPAMAGGGRGPVSIVVNGAESPRATAQTTARMLRRADW